MKAASHIIAAHGLSYWTALVNQTRRYGNCYVHAGAREEALSPSRAFAANHGDREVLFSFCSWGRSLTTRKGHKYKVHARYVDTGKPVPTKSLAELREAASEY